MLWSGKNRKCGGDIFWPKLSASAIATQLVVSGLLFYCSVFRVIIITMSQMHHRNCDI